MAVGEFYSSRGETFLFEILDFVIRERSNNKEHYTVCFIKIHKTIPCNMVEFYSEPQEIRDKIFEKCLSDFDRINGFTVSGSIARSHSLTQVAGK